MRSILSSSVLSLCAFTSLAFAQGEPAGDPAAEAIAAYLEYAELFTTGRPTAEDLQEHHAFPLVQFEPSGQHVVIETLEHYQERLDGYHAWMDENGVTQVTIDENIEAEVLNPNMVYLTTIWTFIGDGISEDCQSVRWDHIMTRIDGDWNVITDKIFGCA